MQQQDNIKTNLLQPDLDLLRESKSRLDKFVDFVKRKSGEINVLDNQSSRLFKQRAEMLEKSAQYWVGKGATLYRNGTEVINPFHNGIPKNWSTVYEEWLINMLNEVMTNRYNELTTRIDDYNKQIETKQNDMQAFSITILVPKHSGKPMEGTTVYADVFRIVHKSDDIINLAKKSPTWLQIVKKSNGEININDLTLEDAKAILGNRIYKDAEQVFGNTSTIKTPMYVTIKNFRDREEYLNLEIEYYVQRIAQVNKEQPQSYIYKGEPRFLIPELPIAADMPQSLMMGDKDMRNSGIASPVPTTFGRIRQSLNALLSTIKHVGSTKATYLLPVGFTPNPDRKLWSEYMEMAKSFVEKEDLTKWQTRVVTVESYDFTEYDKLSEQQREDAVYIDPKYYKEDDKYFEWYCGADKMRYSQKVEPNIVNRKSADVNKEELEWVTIVISDGCFNKQI